MFEVSPQRPDERGYFGRFGGRFVPEILMLPLRELEKAYLAARESKIFQAEYLRLLKEIVGRPSMLYQAKRLSAYLHSKTGQTCDVWLKREDLNHTGAHKINNTLGQALLCREMGKKRVIAETGAGQHGVATATACALFDFSCTIYMGKADVERQALNVKRMLMLGAEVIPVESGSQTLKDAMNAALRDWASNVETTYYLVGSAAGPHPYPLIVRDLQAIIGEEARQQILTATGSLPEALIACVGGGSNALGLFHRFVDDPSVALYGVEAGGRGLNTTEHSASLIKGEEGVLHGAFTRVLQKDEGQIAEAHSVAAGLDYPGVGPEHAYLQEIGRATYLAVNDEEALTALKILAKTEGILAALESAHALAGLFKLLEPANESLRAKAPHKSLTRVIVSLSGRGDKDMPQLLTSPY